MKASAVLIGIAVVIANAATGVVVSSGSAILQRSDEDGDHTFEEKYSNDLESSRQGSGFHGAKLVSQRGLTFAGGRQLFVSNVADSVVSTVLGVRDVNEQRTTQFFSDLNNEVTGASPLALSSPSGRSYAAPPPPVGPPLVSPIVAPISKIAIPAFYATGVQAR